jgi:hypothetical protein
MRSVGGSATQITPTAKCEARDLASRCEVSLMSTRAGLFHGTEVATMVSATNIWIGLTLMCVALIFAVALWS